jgi:hypothetical protein
MTESSKPVATVERDESRDVWVKFDSVDCPQIDGSSITRVYPCDVAPHGSRFVSPKHKRFVPIHDLQTETARRVEAEKQLEERKAQLSEAISSANSCLDNLLDQTETMLKLRAFVERIANGYEFGIAEEFASQAQDLLLEISK